MTTKMTWDAAEMDAVLAGWAQGQTMKQIGAALGTSRSAVSGRLTKLGLFGEGGRADAARLLAERTGVSVEARQEDVGKPDAETPPAPALCAAEPIACCDGTRDDECDACLPRHGEDLDANRLVTTNGEAVAVEINSHEAGIIRKRTRRDAPGNVNTLGQWLPPLLRGMSAAIQPEAADDVHDRHAQFDVIILGAGKRRLPLLMTTRPFGSDGHVMASAHHYEIDEGLLIVNVEPSAYLLKKQHEDGHLDSAGDAETIQDLERLIG